MIEHNPARYRELSEPRTDDELDSSIKEFYKAVQELRVQHKLPDVHVIIKVNVKTPTGEVPAFATAHFGAMVEAESMCAYGFARAGEERKQWVDQSKENGIRAVRKSAA